MTDHGASPVDEAKPGGCVALVTHTRSLWVSCSCRSAQPSSHLPTLAQTHHRVYNCGFSSSLRTLRSRICGMDWARDHACLSSSEPDLQRFTYNARPAVVIKIARSNHVGYAVLFQVHLPISEVRTPEVVSGNR